MGSGSQAFWTVQGRPPQREALQVGAALLGVMKKTDSRAPGSPCGDRGPGGRVTGSAPPRLQGGRASGVEPPEQPRGVRGQRSAQSGWERRWRRGPGVRGVGGPAPPCGRELRGGGICRWRRRRARRSPRGRGSQHRRGGACPGRGPQGTSAHQVAVHLSGVDAQDHARVVPWEADTAPVSTPPPPQRARGACGASMRGASRGSSCRAGGAWMRGSGGLSASWVCRRVGSPAPSPAAGPAGLGRGGQGRRARAATPTDLHRGGRPAAAGARGRAAPPPGSGRCGARREQRREKGRGDSDRRPLGGGSCCVT